MSIVLPRHLPVGAGRDDGDRATLSDYLDECVGVVPLIGNHILYGVRQEQRLSLGDIMGLACRELEMDLTSFHAVVLVNGYSRPSVELIKGGF